MTLGAWMQPDGTPAIQLLTADIQLPTAENKQNATTVPNDHWPCGLST